MLFRRFGSKLLRAGAMKANRFAASSAFRAAAAFPSSSSTQQSQRWFSTEGEEEYEPNDEKEEMDFARSVMQNAPLKQLTDTAKYAAALHHWAKPNGKMESIRDNLNAYVEAVQENETMSDMLGLPVAPAAEKQAFINESLKALDIECPETNNFLNFLVEAEVIADLAQIADEYSALVDEETGVVKGEIVSAQELTDAQLAAISAKMEKLAPEGKKLEISSRVDSSMLGGLVLTVGDKGMDLSALTHLEEIEKGMKSLR